MHSLQSVTQHASSVASAAAADNGGDALVAARHLAHFGYAPYVVYPKQKNIALYTVRQFNPILR